MDLLLALAREEQPRRLESHSAVRRRGEIEQDRMLGGAADAQASSRRAAVADVA